MLDKILLRYGQCLQLQTEQGQQTIRAFLQPVTGRGENMVRVGNTPVGREAEGQFVLIASVEPRLRQGDLLTGPEGSYILRRCEIVEGIGGPAYCWGMCVRKGAEDRWGMSG